MRGGLRFRPVFGLRCLLLFLGVCGHAAFAEDILFSLGYRGEEKLNNPDQNGESWNIIPTWLAYRKARNVDAEGIASDVVWETQSPFYFYYTDGLIDESAGEPGILRRGLMLLKGKTETADVILQGLNANALYDFTMAASFGGKGSRRGLRFEISGEDSHPKSGVLAVEAGAGGTLDLNGIRPSSQGDIRIRAFLPEDASAGYWGTLRVRRQQKEK